MADKFVGAPEKIGSPIAGLDVWRRLPQWKQAPPGKPWSVPVRLRMRTRY